jgi:SAM-dependent methyltransferase
VKAIYHRVVPAQLRYPVGRFRRRVAEWLLRSISPYPYPPPELLARIQTAPTVREYRDVGRRCAESIIAACKAGGVSAESTAAVLDFGCGPGRVLRYLASTSWVLYGCDLDESAIDWSRASLPFARFAATEPVPPLPYTDAMFDVVFAVSVFPRMSLYEQRTWASEIARIVRPEGMAIVTTLSPSVEGAFAHLPLEARPTLNPAWSVARTFAPAFRAVSWRERGLDGFEDLTLLRRN